MPDLRGEKVLITGGGGFLGRRLVARLKEVGADPVVIRSSDYDLIERDAVRRMLDEKEARYVIHAAAVVGGIGANREHPGSFFYANAIMGIHLIHEAMKQDVSKLAVVGTVCSYPKFTPVPFREEDIWNGYPEETNAPYGLAKKMLLVQLQAYRDEFGFNGIYIIPTNLYGPHDNFDLHTSHVIPALIRKCVEARNAGHDEVTLWGTGSASREFLYVDDAAAGIVAGLENYESSDPVNLGSNREVSIKELAEMIADVTGFEGRFVWDASKPDGQPRRAVDGTRAEHVLGWKAKMDLREGLRRTYEWFETSPHEPANA